MKNGVGYFEIQVGNNLAAQLKKFGVFEGGGGRGCVWVRGWISHGMPLLHDHKTPSTVALENNTGEKDSWGYYCMGWVPRGVGGPSSPRSAIKLTHDACPGG